MVALATERVEQPIRADLKLMLVDPVNANTRRNIKSSCLNFQMLKMNLAAIDETNEEVLDVWKTYADDIGEKVKELQKLKV